MHECWKPCDEGEVRVRDANNITIREAETIRNYHYFYDFTEHKEVDLKVQ